MPVLLVLALVLMSTLPVWLAGGEALSTRLQVALTGADSPETALIEHGTAILPDDLTIGEVSRRVGRVEGWDVLAFVGPFATGADIAGEPGIRWRPSWLRVAATSGISDDGYFVAVVMRHGFVVGQFDLYTQSALGSFVVRRESSDGG